MKNREIEERVERVIRACRDQGIEPTSETVAQIMIDQDMDSETEGERSRRAVAAAYAEYKKAATWLLMIEDAESEQTDGPAEQTAKSRFWRRHAAT
jgi:hypothetical protein